MSGPDATRRPAAAARRHPRAGRPEPRRAPRAARRAAAAWRAPPPRGLDADRTGRARRPARPRRRRLPDGAPSCAPSPTRGAGRSWSSTPPRASPRASRTARCCSRCRTSCSTAARSPPSAVGADEVIVCVCESATDALDGAALAIAERERRDRGGPRTHLRAVPDRYVAGQESALVNHLNGGPALPTFTPPMPFERGVRRRPTLVNNAETLAHLALIARHGPQLVPRARHPHRAGLGARHAVRAGRHPGVYEIEHGASLSSLIDAAGGAGAPLRAVLIGGYAGTWIDGGPAARGRALRRTARAHGASLGAGVVLLLSEDACPVAETRARGALAGGAERRPVRAVRARPRRARDAVEAVASAAPSATRSAPRAPGRAGPRPRRVRPPRRRRAARGERAGGVRRGVRRPRPPRPVRRLRTPSELPRPRAASDRSRSQPPGARTPRGARTDDALAMMR